MQNQGRNDYQRRAAEVSQKHGVKLNLVFASLENYMHLNDVSKCIVDAAIEVHRNLGGPGLLENVYEEALTWELLQRGFVVERQLLVPIKYKGNELASPLRLDLLVGKNIVVEIKATSNYNPIFESQVLTYLRMLDLKIGLVINFGEKFVKDGIHRVVNGLVEPR